MKAVSYMKEIFMTEQRPVTEGLNLKAMFIQETSSTENLKEKVLIILLMKGNSIKEILKII